jgi:hypothetical protein
VVTGGERAEICTFVRTAQVPSKKETNTMRGEVKNPYGCRDGRIVYVKDVDNGIGCRCTCPACNAPLVARQGEEVTWHFAHASESSCTSAPESGLHRMAKQILLDARRIRVPISEMQVHSGQIYSIADPVTVDFEEIYTERAHEDIVPDLLAIVGGVPLFIEIAVTHFIDAEKMEKIRRIGISTLEINLRSTNRGIDPDRLRDLLVDELPNKRWKYNAKVESMRAHYEKLDRERIDEENRRIESRREAQRLAEREKRKAEEAERERRRLADQAEQKRLEAEEAARREQEEKERAERRKQQEIELEKWKREEAERAVIREKEREIERQREEEEDRKRLEKDRAYKEEYDRRMAERAKQREERERREAEWSKMGSDRLRELDDYDRQRTQDYAEGREVHRQREERREAVEREKIDEARESAYQKRREYDLQMWTQAEQMKYRDLCDKEGMTHVQATAAVSEIHRATADERAAEYDRTHRPRFKFNAVTGRGGYV